MLQSQPGGVFGRCFAEHIAVNANQVPGRIVGAARQPCQVGSFVTAALDQVTDAQQAEHGLLAPLQGAPAAADDACGKVARSEEHTSELQSLMRISYAVFCLKKKTNTTETYDFIPDYQSTFLAEHYIPNDPYYLTWKQH